MHLCHILRRAQSACSSRRPPAATKLSVVLPFSDLQHRPTQGRPLRRPIACTIPIQAYVCVHDVSENGTSEGSKLASNVLLEMKNRFTAANCHFITVNSNAGISEPDCNYALWQPYVRRFNETLVVSQSGPDLDSGDGGLVGPPLSTDSTVKPPAPDTLPPSISRDLSASKSEPVLLSQGDRQMIAQLVADVIVHKVLPEAEKKARELSQVRALDCCD